MNSKIYKDFNLVVFNSYDCSHVHNTITDESWKMSNLIDVVVKDIDVIMNVIPGKLCEIAPDHVQRVATYGMIDSEWLKCCLKNILLKSPFVSCSMLDVLRDRISKELLNMYCEA